jgi:hypothetical protein
MVEVPSFDLSPTQLAYIGEVGAALFEGRGLQASRSGLISIRPTFETRDEKGVGDEQRKGSSRPEARPWPRRQRARGSSDSHAAELGRAEYRFQVSNLREHYPGTRAWDGDTNGLWLAVPTLPLGEGGPRANLHITIPRDRDVPIVSWGFWELRDETCWVGHRHTNYPDGSICAFPPDGDFWVDGQRLVDYADLLSEWCF